MAPTSPANGGRVERSAYGSVGMDLTAALSNHETARLYQRLTERGWRRVARVQGKRRNRTSNGKLRFGTVSGAVLQILHRAPSPMRFIEIHQAVEELLGFQVDR